MSVINQINPDINQPIPAGQPLLQGMPEHPPAQLAQLAQIRELVAQIAAQPALPPRALGIQLMMLAPPAHLDQFIAQVGQPARLAQLVVQLAQRVLQHLPPPLERVDENEEVAPEPEAQPENVAAFVPAAAPLAGEPERNIAHLAAQPEEGEPAEERKDQAGEPKLANRP